VATLGCDKFIWNEPDDGKPPAEGNYRLEVSGSDLYIYNHDNGNLIQAVPMVSGSTSIDFSDPNFIETFDNVIGGGGYKKRFEEYLKALRVKYG